MASTKKTLVFVRLPTPLHKQFKAACDRERRSMNGRLLMLVEGWVNGKSVEDAPPPARGKKEEVR